MCSFPLYKFSIHVSVLRFFKKYENISHFWKSLHLETYFPSVQSRVFKWKLKNFSSSCRLFPKKKKNHMPFHVFNKNSHAISCLK